MHMRSLMIASLAPVVLLLWGCGTTDVDSSAPVITQQPRSKTVPAGRSVTFTVTAAGSPAPSYQWRKNDTNMAETNESFTIPSVQAADTATYSVVVSNSKGSVTSSGAVLKLWTPPVMRSIAGGTFQMGDSLDLEELPIHAVTVSSFFMDTTPVTQADYEMLMGLNPSRYIGDSLRPVEQVTWFDALLCCNARSRADGKDTVYSYTSLTGTPGNGCTDLGGLAIDYTKNGYRLPTEAEWEYACRAGTTTDFYWGGSYPPVTAADTAAMDSNAVWWHHSADTTTVRTGTKLPNAWGLYDMIGNVWEWCNDWWNSGYYSSSPSVDPTGSSTGDRRMVRGGGWEVHAERMLSSERGYIAPNLRGGNVGLRCVRR